MLIFYLIGINLEDLLFLTKDNLMNGRIEYYRHKTGKLFSIKVEPEAQSILDKYKGDRYLLNIMDNRSNYTSFTTSIDRALKQIGEVSILKRGKRSEILFSQNCPHIGQGIHGLHWQRNLIYLKKLYLPV